ncbi:hypothetical protein K9N50_05320 [bacterium]|nr:hypothetical protein [bacterium]
MIETPACKRRVLVLLSLIFLISVFNSLYAYDNDTDRTGIIIENANEIVEFVIDAYESGDINHAENLALKALDDTSRLSRQDQFTLYKYLAFCAVANDDEAGGIRRFKSALSLKPNVVADPITWSPKVRRVFDRALTEFTKNAETLELNRNAIVAEICRTASFKSLYLPGSGQILKGSKGKGILFGALFWGMAATFVYSQASLPDSKDRYLNATNKVDAMQRWKDYRNMQHIVTISGIATATIYTYIFFDALLFKPNPKKVAERY